MKKIVLPAIVCATLLSSAINAQSISDFKTYKSQATGNLDARHLFETLIGEGIVLKSYSITKTHSEEAYGFFEDKKSSLGMKKGLIMTTGGISGLCSGNTTGSMSNVTHAKAENRLPNNNLNGMPCPELENLLQRGQKTFDLCFIELDVVPTADTLSFNYVFGSEEYDEFVGSSYNDVFGFFISGKGIDGEKNLAVVPGTNTPVSVNTINNGSKNGYTVRVSNPSYYVSNLDGKLAIEYDGLTKLMEIRQPVTPYESYHIKLAIADVSDNSYDSGVLIEGQSFVSYEKSYNVLYGKNSDDIDEGYQTLLTNLAKVYLANPKGKIIITGHTDNEGSEELNEQLSCSRATGVVDYLVSKGISKDRIIMNCKGETQPKFTNTTEQGKILNRRVEIKIGGALEEYTEKKNEETKAIKFEDSKLLTNYPNPFNDYTTIEAYLKDDVKDAKIVVTDINGKILKTIYLLERGKTSTYFDGQNLPNGMYVATLIVDNKTSETIKMVVTH